MMLEQTDIFQCDPNHRDAQDLMRRFSAHQQQFTNGSPLRPLIWNGMCGNASLFLMAQSDKGPVACGALMPITRQTAELRRIYAEPGYGKMMIDALQHVAKEKSISRLVLTTRKENIRSIQFYCKNGFVFSDRYWPYQDDENAVCFEKAIELGTNCAPKIVGSNAAKVNGHFDPQLSH